MASSPKRSASLLSPGEVRKELLWTETGVSVGRRMVTVHLLLHSIPRADEGGASGGPTDLWFWCWV